MALPIEENVRRIGHPCLWVLTLALRWGVAAGVEDIQSERSSLIALRCFLDLFYQEMTSLW